MGYRITDYTKQQAKKLGVEVKPSKTKGKKIDVFKKGKKVASVGAIGYKDFPTYSKLEKRGIYEKGYANKKKETLQNKTQKRQEC